MTGLLPGARHDAYCFKEYGLNRFLDSSTLADKGYIGSGLVIPNKRPAGEKLGRNLKVVVHIGFRWPLGSYGRVFSVVRGLVFLAVGRTL